MTWTFLSALRRNVRGPDHLGRALKHTALVELQRSGMPLIKSKNSVQGGGGRRKRWKDLKGRIFEWDSQHGTVEMYDKQGKHLGEFNPETGEQTKPAKPGRTTPK